MNTSFGSTVDQAQRPYTNLQLQRRATKAKHAKLTTNSQTVEEKKIEKEEAAEKERRKKSKRALKLNPKATIQDWQL